MRLRARWFAARLFLTAASLTGVAYGDPPNQAPSYIQIPDAGRQQRFQIADPQATQSLAQLQRTGRNKDGSLRGLEPGYLLTSTVVFRLTSEADSTALQAAHPTGTHAKLVAAPGFHSLTFANIQQAADAAAKLADDVRVQDVSLDMLRPSAPRNVPTDPNFPEQWHLKNTVTPIADVNAEPAWDAGWTGAGVVIGICDYGVCTTHPDLAPTYNAAATQAGLPVNSHGTSAAGVAAAAAYNNFLGSGLAYGAQWSGQWIGGTDSQQADAMAFANDLNHIKSNSWGPNDIAVLAPVPPVIGAAIANGVATGRGGKGEIYVWAGGNGAQVNDRVDYDGYANERYVIAIAAVGDLDSHSYYSEPGACVLAAAASDGNVRKIATTTGTNQWTTGFGGTSSACPLAAGAIALALQANPGLTWRDVQHVIVNSARVCDPNQPSWVTNGAGHQVNQFYGFGAVDAAALANTALGWHNVGHEVTVDTGVVAVNTAIPDNDPNGVTRTVAVGQNIRIESVEMILNVTHTFIGDLDIRMTSPAGTESIFATVHGDGTNNYVNYPFDSKRLWDEHSAGTWTVKIYDGASMDSGTWDNFQLLIHGTPRCPGNINGDGQVELGDLAALLAAFGACEADSNFVPAADIDNSGCIDLSDLAFLLSVYGNVCPP